MSNKAQLYVKGMREPIELEVQEGNAAQRLIADAAMPLNTPFSIEGVWTGTKAEMKFVSFPKEEERSYSKGYAAAMSREQAIAFFKELKPFREQAVSEGFHAYDGEFFWLQAQGAIRLTLRGEDGKNVPSLYGHGTTIVDTKKLEEAEHRLEAYKAYVDKVSYAKRKESEALEATAAKEALLASKKL